MSEAVHRSLQIIEAIIFLHMRPFQAHRQSALLKTHRCTYLVYPLGSTDLIGFRVQGSGFRVPGPKDLGLIGFRVWGVGFRVYRV